MKRLQVVRFRSLKKPQEDEFCLELSMLHTYDEVVESVARHLGLDDPSKIRLTSHNCYSLQPKPQPIKYRGVGHLLDMLVHYNQTSDILYYEVLDIPLPELQELKTLEVSFHHSTKAEVVIHTIRLPKQSTVGDVFNDLKTKVELSHPNAELRLLEIFYHKIYKIFPLCEKIDNINDQYWTLRAEEIPEEEKNLGPHDRIIHVYHFTKETAQNQVASSLVGNLKSWIVIFFHPLLLVGGLNLSTSELRFSYTMFFILVLCPFKQQVQNFGEPFMLVIREGERLAEVKVRIQTKLQVPDEEFSKWKFAFLSLGQPEYLQDSDIVSSRFQKREVYGAWEQYLGLEHSNNSPKRSNAGNQVVERVPSESTRSVNGSHRISKDETPEGNICAITRASGHASNGQASDNAGGRNIVPSDDAALAAGKVSFLSYSVSSKASLLLERIHSLHGGTFTRFSVTNRFMQTGVLESLASFIESMSMTKVNEMNEEALQLAANSVKDFELVGLDLSWLKQRLDEAKRMNKRSDSLNDVVSYETALIGALAKVRELEEGLAKAMAEAEILSKDFPESLGMNDCVLKGVL